MHPRYLLILSATLTCRSSAASRRSNLYFRLIVFPIETPPLRERLEDVIALAADFLQQPAKRLNITVPRLTDENIRELCNYGWLKNVRELQNVLERALIVSGGGRLRFDLGDFSPPVAKLAEIASPVRTRAQLLELERQQIVEALEKTNGKSMDRTAPRNYWDCARPHFRQRSLRFKIRRIARRSAG